MDHMCAVDAALCFGWAVSFVSVYEGDHGDRYGDRHCISEDCGAILFYNSNEAGGRWYTSGDGIDGEVYGGYLYRFGVAGDIGNCAQNSPGGRGDLVCLAHGVGDRDDFIGHFLSSFHL